MEETARFAKVNPPRKGLRENPPRKQPENEVQYLPSILNFRYLKFLVIFMNPYESSLSLLLSAISWPLTLLLMETTN